jgi:hypothetical protein
MHQTLRLPAAAVAVALGLAACVAPPGPAERLAESAYDMNTASRFGRVDVAIDYVVSAAQEEFARRRAAWGRDLRVVDVELTGIRMLEGGEASVLLSVSWQRLDEISVRVTHLEQRWKDGRGEWRMASEERSGGDAGLLNERPKSSDGAPRGPAATRGPTSGDARNSASPTNAVAANTTRAAGLPPSRQASFQSRILRAPE